MNAFHEFKATGKHGLLWLFDKHYCWICIQSKACSIDYDHVISNITVVNYKYNNKTKRSENVSRVDSKHNRTLYLVNSRFSDVVTFPKIFMRTMGPLFQSFYFQ